MTGGGKTAATVVLGVAAATFLSAAAPAQAEIYWSETSFDAPDEVRTIGESFCGEAGHVAISTGFDTSTSLVSDPDDLIYAHTAELMRELGDRHSGAYVSVHNYDGGADTNPAAITALCSSRGQKAGYRLEAGPEAYVPDGSERGVRMDCDRGLAVVGGGALNASDLPDNALLTSSGPIDLGYDRDRIPDDGWRVEVNNGPGADPGPPWTYLSDPRAICDHKHPEAMEYRTEREIVADGEIGGGVAKCRQGQTLLGGGAISRSKYEERTLLVESYPRSGAREQWSALVHNADTPDDEATAVEITAICR